MRGHPERRRDPSALWQIPPGREDEIPGNDAVFQNVTGAVNVSQKKVEGLYALLQPLLEPQPVLCGDDAGNGVKVKKLLPERPILINAKPDAVAFHPRVDHVPVFNKRIHTFPRQRFS